MSAHLPLAVASEYDIRPPNRRRTLFQGRFTLAHGRQLWRCRGSVHLAWAPGPVVRFQAAVSSKAEVDLGDGRTLSIPGAANARASVTQATWIFRRTAQGSVNGPLRIGRDRPVHAIRLHVVNFHHYVGAPARFAGGGGGPVRLTLDDPDWAIEFDERPEYNKIRDLLRAQGGYGVGHIAMIKRRDGRLFKAADADDLRTCLHRFLSFARGLWCGAVIAEGLGARRPVWTEWTSHPLVTDWQGVSSWFPADDPKAVGVAFRGFRDLWKQATWRQTLREVIHWYVEANLNAGAIEGSLVLGHAALERLSWVHLVGHRGRGGDAFDRLPSGRRIEALLTDLQIPSGLPASLAPDLASWATSHAFRTGPWAMSEVRNTLVHPRRREMLTPASPQVRIQARQLGLQYIELALLGLCGYRGKYVSRLHRGPTIMDATETVPWATTVNTAASPPATP